MVYGMPFRAASLWKEGLAPESGVVLRLEGTAMIPTHSAPYLLHLLLYSLPYTTSIVKQCAYYIRILVGCYTR